MEGAGVELQPDDGKDENGEHNKKADLHERCQGLENGLQNHLET